jgi:MHS family proline/betaine transporter-like MFS transporter
MLGCGAASAVTMLLAHAALNERGLADFFVAAGVIGGGSVMLRRNLPRSEHFVRHHNGRGDTSPLLQAIIFASAYGVIFYLPLV